MDIVKEDQLRQEFRDILFSLAESQEMLRDEDERLKIYERLEKLYYSPNKDDSFRHFYSDIFSVLTSLKNHEKPGSSDILGQNLSVIRQDYHAINTDENGKPIDISYAIRKLYDHVSLDMARMGYSDAEDRKLSQKESLSIIQAQVNAARAATESVQAQLATQENKLKNVQKEYIAILGIFASIVLAFTGGIAFSTSVLQNLHAVSVYRITGAILLIGIVLTNILYGLFYYVDRLVNKPDTRKIKPLLIANAILIIFLIVMCIGWWFGVAENRNARINSATTEQTVADPLIATNDDNITLETDSPPLAPEVIPPKNNTNS